MEIATMIKLYIVRARFWRNCFMSD